MQRLLRLFARITPLFLLTLLWGSGATSGAAAPISGLDLATPTGDPCLATPEPQHSAAPRAMSGTPAAMSEFDLVFIDSMIPHHESAVAMARVGHVRAEREEIRQLTEEIIASQSTEIEQMRTWRTQWYGDAPMSPPDAMSQMMNSMMAEMDSTPGAMDQMGQMDRGMMDPAMEVQALCEAPAPFDRAFIEAMSPHHQSAVAMATMAREHAQHPEVKELARNIIASQQGEIDQMMSWREAWYGGTPVATSHGGPAVDHVSLVDALRGHGLTVDPAGSVSQPFLTGDGTILRLSRGGLAGSAEIQSYAYDDPAAAQADADKIGPDGNPRQDSSSGSVGVSIVEWIGPPHLFHRGGVLVIYVGADPSVLGVLSDLLGPQFAGR